MQLRSRLAGALLAGGILTAVLGSQVSATAATPRAVRHPERVIPGRLVDYRAGVQDGRTTRVGPVHDATLLAAPLSDWRIVFKGSGWTTAARLVLRSAVGYWAAQLQSAVPIKVVATFKDLPGTVLGSAGPTSLIENWDQGTPAPFADVFYPIALANRLAGVDLNGTAPEIVAQFDSRMPWYMGTDNVVPANRISFRGTVLHELGHGVGFLGSGWGGAGTPAIGDEGNGHAWVFDLFAERGDRVPLWDRLDNAPNLTTAQTKAALKSGDLWFSGPATSPRTQLYAPAVWEPGSSYSHLDERTYPRGSLDSLMTPVGDFGEGNATAGPLVLGMLQDMGWSEPVDTACTKPGDLDGDGFNDVVGIASNGDLVYAPGTDTGRLLARRVIGIGYGALTHLVIGDWTGDGCADLIGYHRDDDAMVLIPVTGSADVGAASELVDFSTSEGTWTVTGIAAVGDLDGDGGLDLLVRTDRSLPTARKGELWRLEAGSMTSMGTGWAAFTEFFSPGDWNGDGRGDLFVRVSANNGTLRMFPGRADGSLGAARVKGTGWDVYDELFGSRDLTGDGFPEIVGRSASSGSLLIERASRTGGFLAGTPTVSRNWGAFPVID